MYGNDDDNDDDCVLVKNRGDIVHMPSRMKLLLVYEVNKVEERQKAMELGGAVPSSTPKTWGREQVAFHSYEQVAARPPMPSTQPSPTHMKTMQS